MAFMTTLPQLTPVRSRFAPSPTGYLHLGGARTALFAWALARHLGGQFILRIEDTDLERSTPEAVQAILDGMAWLDLGYEEGPYYQMQRMERYREVIADMLRQGTAYYCYSSPQELDAMREAQRARGEKPRYDGRWRPERDKALPSVPEGVKPVVRFRNPLDGEVTWHDFVKGTITISNRELDDLIIARPDGTPTYNFCVVVDDWDMRITHVIRGADHVNNTPRQINILKALGAEQGYLPEAMINYLARLGWSHGDDEIFSREQLVQWFDVEHLSKSAAQWDPKKLNWLNQHYIKQADLSRLEAWVRPRVEQLGGQWQGAPALAPVLALLRDRCETLQQLAEAALLFYAPFQLDPALRAEHVTAAVLPALRDFAQQAQQVAWTKEALAGLIKTVITQHGLKMPQFAIPLRVLVTGRTQTPSVDAVLELLGRETVLARLSGL